MLFRMIIIENITEKIDIENKNLLRIGRVEFFTTMKIFLLSIQS